MNIARIIATATLTAVCAGVTLVGAPAQAAPSHLNTAVVNGDRCHDRGVTNYYVHHWQAVPVQKILNSTMVFAEHRCWVNGFRLYKANANTPAEVAFARHFLSVAAPLGDPDPQVKPTVFCRTKPGHAYFLDLAYFWADISPLNVAERHHYTAWAHAYAQRHGCRVFLPKTGS